MKVIFTGSTGLVGAEAIRQALKNPKVTEVVALARRPVSIPENEISADEKAKFKSVIIEDFGKEYSHEVKRSLEGAGACIWNLAVTPANVRDMSQEEVSRICLDYTLVGLKAMAEVANTSRPFRVVYTSGVLSERDQDRVLWFQGRYRKMRGEVENQVFDYASNSEGRVEAQVTKPGLIYGPNDSMFRRTLLPFGLSVVGIPSVDVKELAAAELDQALNGYEKDVLENADLVRLGRKALAQQ